MTRRSARRQPLRDRIRRALSTSRSLRVTRAGRIYLVLTLGVGFGALNTGNNLLYLVLGLQLSTILVSGMLSEACLRSVAVRRLEVEAYAGEPFVHRWSLSRRSGRSFALTLGELHSEVSGTGNLAVLEPEQETTVRARSVAARRGPLRLEAVKVTTSYPFGLFTKGRRIELPGVLVVYPRRVPAPSAGSAPRTEEGLQRPRPDPLRGDAEPAGLRTLLDGEDARRIHWPKSAQAGVLLRVERDRDHPRRVLLRLEPGAGPAFERRCEEVAAEARALLRGGATVGLETCGRRIAPDRGAAQERRLLRALAWAGNEEPRDFPA